MNRIIVHLVAMLALVCAGVASAQTTTETFESFSANATQFTSGGVTFDIATHNIVVFDIYDGSPNSYGWNGTANDKKFIDNTRSAADGGYWGVLPDFSIKTHDGSRFSVGSFWLYPAMFNLTSLGSGGTVTVIGKLGGTTVFSVNANSGFNTSASTSNGYSKIDLTTFGGSNNASKTIDEIEISTGGNFQYLALDALTWTKASGYTIGTAVTPTGAGTLTCNAMSVSPGGSTTCTATVNSGYELNNIAGCNGTASTTSSFTTGAVNANCTVTATFVTALGANISGSTDVSCNGGTNGTATVTASNGVTPYTYSWAPSGGTGATAVALAANTYTVTVTDARSYSIQKSAIISQPAVLALSPSTIPDGVVGAAYSQTFSSVGGTPAYGYSMTGSVPGLSLSGATLSGAPTTTGNYSVTVTAQDAHACTTPKIYAMKVRATVGGTVTGLAAGAAVLLADGTDSIAVSANGPFVFPTALTNGTAYNVTVPAQPSSPPQLCTVTNGVGSVGAGNVTNVAIDCKRLYTVGTAVLPSSNTGTLSCTSTQVASGSTTSCNATPASGYLLDKISGCGGADSQTSPFTAGPVTADCTVSASFVPALSAAITQTNPPSCNGGSNGSLTATPSGGFSPYTYAWSPSGGSGANANGLAAGNYTVTVKDARNNQTTANATLTDPSAIVLGSVIPPDGVNGVAYAQTTFTASGGTPPLSFAMSTVGGGALPNGLTLASDGTLSGTPTVSGPFMFKVMATDANGCQQSGAQSTVQIRSTIGGTVSGLDAGASLTLANGADTKTVNANGPFAFPTPADSGSAYAVSLQNVSATPPQFCDVTNGAGTVGTGNVGGIAVNCATHLALGVNDDADYATYGESLDYVVGVHNPTTVAASGVQVAVTLSPAFDPSATTWQCLSSGDGSTCASSGSGASLAGTASLPGGATAMWALHAKIDPATTQGTADVDVTATYAAPWSDTDTLVIFRNGFDAAAVANEALSPARADAIVAGGETATFTPAPASSRLVDTLLTLPSSSGIVRVQRLNVTKAPWLRLQWLDAGREHASAWQRADGNAPLAVGAADRVILLEGRGVSAQLPLDPARH